MEKGIIESVMIINPEKTKVMGVMQDKEKIDIKIMISKERRTWG